MSNKVLGVTSIPYKDGEIKVIVAKQDCVLGNHYHKIKTEEFFLLEGSGVIIRDHFEDQMKYTKYMITPNTFHAFKLKKDSILICVCSHPHDKNDDYEK